MSKIIKVSRKKFSQNILTVTIIPAIICIVLIFLLQEYKEFVYFLSVLICAIAILILFYRIRFYPYIISISDKNISIEYLNKSFFKQKSFNGNVEDITIRKEGKNIFLSKQNQMLALINADSIEKEDEKFLFSIFQQG